MSYDKTFICYLTEIFYVYLCQLDSNVEQCHGPQNCRRHSQKHSETAVGKQETYVLIRSITQSVCRISPRQLIALS